MMIDMAAMNSVFRHQPTWLKIYHEIRNQFKLEQTEDAVDNTRNNLQTWKVTLSLIPLGASEFQHHVVLTKVKTMFAMGCWGQSWGFSFW